MFGLPMGPEWLVILVIVVIVFGVGKLPEVGGAIGKGIREFKTNVKDNEPEKPVANTTAATTVKETPVTTTTPTPANTNETRNA